MPMSAKKGPQPNLQATAQQDGDTGLQPSASAPAKPKYDFYSVLSEKEVRIPDAEISAQAKAEQQQQQQLAAAQQAQAQQQAAAQAAAHAPAAVSQNITAAPPSAVQPATTGNGYLLQVGAFPAAADAETLKAKLALQGFVANVQTVNESGQTYHRVRLGPYRSATALEAVKQRLTAAGIKAIALKEGR
jgi:cell division protein FtsN